MIHEARTDFSILLVLLLIIVPIPVFAGPPFLTDDPEPVEYRHWEVYLAATYERTKFEKTGTLPQVEQQTTACCLIFRFVGLLQLPLFILKMRLRHMDMVILR